MRLSTAADSLEGSAAFLSERTNSPVSAWSWVIGVMEGVGRAGNARIVKTIGRGRACRGGCGIERIGEFGRRMRLGQNRCVGRS